MLWAICLSVCCCCSTMIVLCPDLATGVQARPAALLIGLLGWFGCWKLGPSFSGNHFNRFAAVLRNYDPLDYSYGIFWDILDTVSYYLDCEMKDKMKDSVEFAD